MDKEFREYDTVFNQLNDRHDFPHLCRLFVEDPHPCSRSEHFRNTSVPREGVVQGGEVPGEAEGSCVGLVCCVENQRYPLYVHQTQQSWNKNAHHEESEEFLDDVDHIRKRLPVSILTNMEKKLSLKNLIPLLIFSMSMSSSISSSSPSSVVSGARWVSPSSWLWLLPTVLKRFNFRAVFELISPSHLKPSHLLTLPSMIRWSVFSAVTVSWCVLHNSSGARTHVRHTRWKQTDWFKFVPKNNNHPSFMSLSFHTDTIYHSS